MKKTIWALLAGLLTSLTAQAGFFLESEPVKNDPPAKAEAKPETPAAVSAAKPAVKVDEPAVPYERADKAKAKKGGKVAKGGKGKPEQDLIVESRETLPAKVPVIDSGAPRNWAMSTTDRYVRVTLQRWAKEAGYQLVWDVNQDIEVAVDTSFPGTFEEVLLTVLKSLSISDFPVEAVIYQNKVIRIVKLARKE